MSRLLCRFAMPIHTISYIHTIWSHKLPWLFSLHLDDLWYIFNECLNHIIWYSHRLFHSSSFFDYQHSRYSRVSSSCAPRNGEDDFYQVLNWYCIYFQQLYTAVNMCCMPYVCNKKSSPLFNSESLSKTQEFVLHMMGLCPERRTVSGYFMMMEHYSIFVQHNHFFLILCTLLQRVEVRPKNKKSSFFLNDYLVFSSARNCKPFCVKAIIKRCPSCRPDNFYHSLGNIITIACMSEFPPTTKQSLCTARNAVQKAAAVCNFAPLA